MSNEHTHYPPAEELVEEAGPEPPSLVTYTEVAHWPEQMARQLMEEVPDEHRLADDGCPHDQPEVTPVTLSRRVSLGHISTSAADDPLLREARYRHTLQSILHRTGTHIEALLANSGLRYELTCTLDGVQDGRRILIGSSHGDLAAFKATQPTYQPDGSEVVR